MTMPRTTWQETNNNKYLLFDAILAVEELSWVNRTLNSSISPKIEKSLEKLFFSLDKFQTLVYSKNNNLEDASVRQFFKTHVEPSLLLVLADADLFKTSYVALENIRAVKRVFND